METNIEKLTAALKTKKARLKQLAKAAPELIVHLLGRAVAGDLRTLGQI